MLPVGGFKRYLAIFALILGGFTALAIVSSYALRHQILSHLVQSKGYHVQNNADGSWKLQVPPAKVPKTPSQATAAAPIQLLPAHWEQGGQAKPGAHDALYVPAAVKTRIGAAALGFLSRWETFPAGASDRQYASWERRLRPFVAAGSEGVYTRDESYQPSAICPQAPCVVGSAWYTAYPAQDPVTVQAYEGDSAFVTVYGLVRYLDPGGRLDNTVVLRDYGLTLTAASGRWQVVRAVADTVTTGS